MELSWLDAIAATPVIGVRPAAAWRTALAYANATTSYMALLEAKGVGFKHSFANAGAQIEVETGIVLRVAPDSITAECNHRTYRIDQVPGAPFSFTPVREDPYTVLLEECRSHLTALLQVLAGASPMKINRIGVVAACTLAPHGVPPGLANLVGHIDAPWSTPLRTLDLSMLALIVKAEEHVDQCHHRLKLDRTAGRGGIDIVLDWQRLTDDGTPLPGSEEAYEDIVATCLRDAQAYFEQVGDGGFIDADF